MKKVILMAACLFAFNAINAQEPEPQAPKGNGKQTVAGKKNAVKKETPEQRAQKITDRLDSEVTLAADQKTKVYDLALTRTKNADAVREKYKGQADKKEAAKAELTEIRKAFRKETRAILTAEQLEKLKAKAKANRAQKNNAVAPDALTDDKD